ncbi:MAG: hypothetical protein ABEL51_07440, partial [Salinibacter sp.]
MKLALVGTRRAIAVIHEDALLKGAFNVLVVVEHNFLIAKGFVHAYTNCDLSLYTSALIRPR